jgi:rod shape-determining protein MreD
MKKIFLIFICLVLFIFDNTLVPFLNINTYYPSFLFIFALCYSIINGKWEALWIGILTGVLQDIYFFHGFGINSLVNMIVCIIAAALGESLFTEKSLIPVLSTFALGILKGFLVFAILYIVGQQADYKAIVYCSLYDAFVAALMYKKIYVLSQRPFMKRKWKF